MLTLIHQRNVVTINEVILRYIIFVLFFLFFGLRTIDSGVDTRDYRVFFDAVNSGLSLDVSDIGFVSLAKIVGFFLSDSKIFILFLFLLQYLFLHSALQVFRVKNVSFFMIVFLFFMPGFDLFSNAVRQGLSVSICFLSLGLYSRGYIVGSLSLVLCASSVHISAILFLGVYFFRRVNFSGVTVFLLIGVPCVFIFTNYAGMSLSRGLDELGLPGTVGFLISKLHNYETYDDGRLSGIYKLYFFLMFYLPVLMFVISCRKDNALSDVRVKSIVTFYLAVMMVYAAISRGTFSFRILYVIYPIFNYLLIYLHSTGTRWFRAGVALVVFLSGILVLNSGQMETYSFGVD